MDKKMYEKMHSSKGFVAALDQSGGSTPKALKNYGISEDKYSNEKEMYDLIHEMRSRVITSPSFTSDQIIAAILFRRTMNSKIEDKYTAEYLWQEKGIVPLLKVDLGMIEKEDDVQLMKPIVDLDEQLEEARNHGVFGTKMRSVIWAANPKGIKKIIDQQFEFGQKIFDAGLVPILEPEVNIDLEDKAEAEEIMLKEIKEHLAKLDDETRFMFKFTIPTKAGLYSELMEDPHVCRVVALSGGYSLEKANDLLKENPGLIASFSRALLNDIRAQQTEDEFNKGLKATVDSIYEASIV